MIYLIPGELLSLLTLPGVVLHEIAHRFFCDVFNIPVYAIHYFRPLSKTAGCVVHHPTDNVVHQFFIGAGPLIFNSIVCMFLTLPRGTAFYLQTDFVQPESCMIYYAQLLMTWLGYSIGLHALPSNQDVNGLADNAESFLGWFFLSIFEALVSLANIPLLGWFFRIAYAYALSLVLPIVLLSHHTQDTNFQFFSIMKKGAFSLLFPR